MMSLSLSLSVSVMLGCFDRLTHFNAVRGKAKREAHVARVTSEVPLLGAFNTRSTPLLP